MLTVQSNIEIMLGCICLEAAGTPEEVRSKYKFAAAWSKDILSANTLHLPSGYDSEGGNISQSPSTSSLLGLKENLETHSMDEIVEKLHHENNIFVQADYLTYLFSTQ